MSFHSMFVSAFVFVLFLCWSEIQAPTNSSPFQFKPLPIQAPANSSPYQFKPLPIQAPTNSSSYQCKPLPIQAPTNSSFYQCKFLLYFLKINFSFLYFLSSGCLSSIAFFSLFLCVCDCLVVCSSESRSVDCDLIAAEGGKEYCREERGKHQRC